MLKKGDVILVSITLVFVLASIILLDFLREKDNIQRVAIIKQDNKIIEEINLDSIEEPRRIKLQGEYKLTILIEKGRIRFEEASCPDKLCVKTGWITNPGEVAVCLPAHSIIKIKGEKPEVDGVSF